ncbi:MAG: right-handed parallel beta-helix repeat-containing protein, partial [Planctomycetes bacterium]|nr:right-handed parallel beta-helix repeat-containing protein [Planctomycetota bacterium]
AALAQTTWHVDAAFCPGPGNGSPGSPFCRIQDGITAALPGDTVLVAPGTYVENVDFLGKAIELRSVRGPLATIVDGGLAGACVSFVNGEGPASIIQGFTLTNGSGRPVTGGGEGGGIACLSSSPTIRGNRIVRNAPRWGGGIACRSGSSPLIVGNLIADNTAPGAGGGLYLHTNCAPRLENNLIFRNRVASATGGGLYIGYNSTPTLVHNTIYANAALNAGGAFSFQSNATLTSCIVWGNTPNQLLNVVNVTYSDVQGGLAGTGNVNTDPLFVDPASDDFHLSFGSPCIDAGTSGGPGFDFEGDSRTSSAAPDMGADEFATRFYLAGVPRAWNTLDLRFIGGPNASPVFALLSTDFLPAPLPIPPFGDLLLLPPFTAFPMGALSAQGTLSVPVLVPGPGGYSLALQALIGVELTNGIALYVP